MFSWHWVEPIAHVLKSLGAEHVWVVHGHDGLDELTTTGATDVAELKDGNITVFEVTPADASKVVGLQREASSGCSRPSVASFTTSILSDEGLLARRGRDPRSVTRRCHSAGVTEPRRPAS